MIQLRHSLMSQCQWVQKILPDEFIPAEMRGQNWKRNRGRSSIRLFALIFSKSSLCCCPPIKRWSKAFVKWGMSIGSFPIDAEDNGGRKVLRVSSKPNWSPSYSTAPPTSATNTTNNNNHEEKTTPTSPPKGPHWTESFKAATGSVDLHFFQKWLGYAIFCDF